MTKNAPYQEIIPGQWSREEVRNLMGSPTATSTYGQEIWYYIHMRTAQAAFLDPEITRQQVIAVTFRPDGVVDTVQLDDGALRRNIAISDDHTPSAGHDISVAEQLLGNLGRFNPQKKE